MLKESLTILFLCVMGAPCFAMAQLGTNAPTLSCQNTHAMADINFMLKQHADTLSPDLIMTVETILSCANKSNLLCNNYLTLIDYSLPSNQKRLWVFDLKDKKLVYHTYVSHGLKSGIFEPYYLTNTLNSKASSLGVFSTDESYHGRDGLSLKLKGLEKHFNDNAMHRSVVMHSAWYVEEDFIKKYGRAGRSWGCPAIPLSMNEPVIDAIKNQSLLVIYYPNQSWLSTSQYLTCDPVWLLNKTRIVEPPHKNEGIETRGDILYGDINKKNKLDSNVPVLTMSAENYRRIFKSPPPLSRMLRKQINRNEYIALNLNELRQLDTNNDKLINAHDKDGIAVIEFFLPQLVKIGGHYRTEFKSSNLGTAIEINLSGSDPILITPQSRITFKSTDQFIRWIGL